MMSKKIIAIMLALALLLSVAAAAPVTVSAAANDDVVGARSGKTGDCTWSLNGTALTIKGYGAMADYPYEYNDKTPWGYDITSVEIYPGVTRIGNYAFKFCEKLETVTIGGSVESIGKSAFSTCKSIKELTIPDSVTSMEDAVFWYCTGLETINLPAHMDSFGSSMFNACRSLKRVDLPEGLTTVPYESFFWCSALEVITVPSTVTSLSIHAFTACYGVKKLELPEGINYIGEEAFSYCTGLESVNIPEGVTKLEDETFRGCKKLTRLDIPEGVTEIGDSAFEDCESLAVINIPDSVETIGDSVFLNTAWLNNQPDGVVYFRTSAIACGGTCPAEVTIRNGTTEIKGGAFKGLTALKKINIPATVTRVGESAFEGCTSLTEVTLPDAVNVIEKGVFRGCESLRNFVLHDGMTEIGEDAFRECTALESVIMPATVTVLGVRAYYHCAALTELLLSEGLTSVGGQKYQYYASEAFDECDSLKSVVFPKNITYVYDTFNRCDSLERVLFCNPDAEYRESFYESAQGEIKIYRLGASGGCTVTYDDHTLTVSGSGKTAEYSAEEPAPWSLFPDFVDQVTSVVAEDGVTGIGDRAFADMTALATVTLPDSVTYVGAQAFDNTAWYDRQRDGLLYLNHILIGCKGECEAKPYIEPGTVTVASGALSGSEGLKSLSLPDSVININKNAFSACPSLTTARVPESVKNIGKGAFRNSPSLKLQCFDGSKAHTYAKDNSIPYELIGGTTGNCRWEADGTRLIISGSGKMKDYYMATESSIPWGTDFTEVVIKEGVTGVGSRAFSKLSKLQKVVIPESVTSFPSIFSPPFPSKTNITVWGYEGSKTQEYCKNNKEYLTFRALGAKGDAEIDGVIDIRDVTAVQQALAELTTFTDRQNAAADTDGDAEVTINDATRIQMYIAEQIDSFD